MDTEVIDSITNAAVSIGPIEFIVILFLVLCGILAWASQKYDGPLKSILTVISIFSFCIVMIYFIYRCIYPLHTTSTSPDWPALRDTLSSNTVHITPVSPDLPVTHPTIPTESPEIVEPSTTQTIPEQETTPIKNTVDPQPIIIPPQQPKHTVIVTISQTIVDDNYVLYLDDSLVCSNQRRCEFTASEGPHEIRLESPDSFGRRRSAEQTVVVSQHTTVSIIYSHLRYIDNGH